MDFSDVVKALKEGLQARREGWGIDSYIVIEDGELCIYNDNINEGIWDIESEDVLATDWDLVQ